MVGKEKTNVYYSAERQKSLLLGTRKVKIGTEERMEENRRYPDDESGSRE